MTESPNASRVTVDGKSFRLGEGKFHPRGVTYGPFAPTAQTGSFPSRSQVLIDLDLVQQLGGNVLRIYDVPPPWFLDLALAYDLRVFIDIPWARHLCVLDRSEQRRAAIETIRRAARQCAGHPAVFAYSVANEIPAEIVRWQGTRRTRRFIHTLLKVARDSDPGCLCTFTSFPPTEYLISDQVDFVCFNVFLHARRAFEAYLARLQMLAGPRPLVLGECGMDSIREGELRKSEVLAWQIEGAFRAGLAGVFVFSFTDDWHRDGRPIQDWEFGLTTRDRGIKESFRAVQRQFRAAPYFRLSRLPRVSVIVACHNGERTLKLCLDALSILGYPDYEVILVDDGSTDATPQIALSYPGLQYISQEHRGLSAARNTGIGAATGEVIAFTDADCRPDSDWLYALVLELTRDGAAAAGGPNYLPPDDSWLAAVVMASPGGPTHVMLNDREAEHVPGCNMAFWRWTLDEIGGFDPVFQRAGDDVDVCWRLLANGRRIHFSPAAVVWHYHRPTLGAYLAQQFGYGEAEALLAVKHPEYFTPLGNSQWRGRIYGPAHSRDAFGRPMVYRGPFGTALFQRIYETGPGGLVPLVISIEFHAGVTLPLLVLGAAFPVLAPLGFATLALSIVAAIFTGFRADIPRAQRSIWSRPLVALLHLLQPMVRGWARHRWRFTSRSTRPTTFRRADARPPRWFEFPSRRLNYFSEHGIDRLAFLQAVGQQLGQESWDHRMDAGWNEWDVEVFGRRWSRIELVTATEELGGGRRLLRCRARSFWSPAAWWILGSLAGIELIVLSNLAPRFPWVWTALALLPVVALSYERERRLVIELVVALIDGVAGALQLQQMMAPSPPAPPPTPRPRHADPDRERDALEELL